MQVRGIELGDGQEGVSGERDKNEETIQGEGKDYNKRQGIQDVKRSQMQKDPYYTVSFM